jgi:hypothetical protein
MELVMSKQSLKLAVSLMAATGALVLLGWRLLEFVEQVWGPGVNPFAVQPAIAPPRPALQVEEIVPEPGAMPRTTAELGPEAGDLPGWRVRPRDESATHVASGRPWRASDTPLWRQPLNGQGNSTPIIVGERVYATVADSGPTLWLACFDLADGSNIWRQPVSREPFPPRHEKTSDAASTPCSDGTRIFVAHASRDTVRLAAFGADGRALWSAPLGPFAASFGFVTSPVWVSGLVITGVDNSDNGFLSAVDAETGRLVWRRRRHQAGEGSYSSPVLVRQPGPEGDAEIVLAGLERVAAFAIADGRPLWSVGGISSTSGATAAIDGGICVATSGYPSRAMVALRLGETGEPSLLWKEDRDSEVPYVPSPLAHDGRLYVVHDDGVAHCRDLATGKVAWKKRIGGTFTASPAMIGGELLCADESGRCTLLALADGTVRHEFALTGGCFATPIVVRDRLIIRTTAELVAFSVGSQ